MLIINRKSEYTEIENSTMMLGQGDDQNMMGWIFAGIASVIASLAGAVATLFKLNQTQVQQSHERLIRDLESKCEVLKQEQDAVSNKADKCFEEREDLRIKLAVLETKVAKLENKAQP